VEHIEPVMDIENVTQETTERTYGIPVDPLKQAP
jgi:hypothetical protein